MSNEIDSNLVFLTKSITNLPEILVHLIQHGIITRHEMEEIKIKATTLEKNDELLFLLQKRNWDEIKTTFLDILRKTKNEHCVNVIERKDSLDSKRQLNNKWWPNEKVMIQSLHKRKFGADKKLLVIEELRNRILHEENENRMVVILESEDARRLSAMGGVGKTLTAKWYANHYKDEYDYILWIDAGDSSSLLQSFKSLARDLDIRNRNEFVYLTEYSSKCYDELKSAKCLWIFDNAEYRGEGGIITALPRVRNLFHCLITSRSRRETWGADGVGFGRIQDFQLDIFTEEESLEFLKQLLKKGLMVTDTALKELCILLGNLPLALQLAVAALNNGQIMLQDYIEKTKTEDLPNIVATEFDDYEKTINKNVRISLDLILAEEKDNKAYEMLLIFGYIQPDDIDKEFFKQILQIDSTTIGKAIELLIKYSLISENQTRTVENQIKSSLSIHRLLQQVIRYNGKDREKESLGKILGCDGFVDYKLIPFTKYADEELKNAFPYVKAELLDQEQLKKYIKEERFEDAVTLAKTIFDEFKTPTANFNYCDCLYKHRKFQECMENLENLYSQDNVEDERTYADDADELGMLKLQEELSKDLVGGHLLIVHWKLGNRKRVEEILESRTEFKIINSTDALGRLIQIVNSDLIHFNYSLTNEEVASFVKLLKAEKNKIVLRKCSLDLNSFNFRLSPDILTLREISFIRGRNEIEEVQVNVILDMYKIKQLTLVCSSKKNNISIDLRDKVTIEDLSLDKVRVLDWSNAQWNVSEQLTLREIPFLEKTKMNFTELRIVNSHLDVSCLPSSTRKLYLEGRQTKVVRTGNTDLPLLRYLSLKLMPHSSCLFKFSDVPLTHVYFDLLQGIYLDNIPKGVTNIVITKISKRTIFIGKLKTVEQLILKEFYSDEVIEVLSNYFQTIKLILYKKGPFRGNVLRELMKIQSIMAIGRISWENDTFESVSRYIDIDRKAGYYSLEGERWQAIEWAEFYEMLS